MVDPKKLRRFQGKGDPESSYFVEASAEFEVWAKAVREQMLDCLRRRSRSSSSD